METEIMQSPVAKVGETSDRSERSNLLLRGKNVLLDTDPVELHGVRTKVFNQAIKRNQERFPPDFVFHITMDGKTKAVTNCDHLRKLKFSPKPPSAFVEHGAPLGPSAGLGQATS